MAQYVKYALYCGAAIAVFAVIKTLYTQIKKKCKKCCPSCFKSGLSPEDQVATCDLCGRALASESNWSTHNDAAILLLNLGGPSATAISSENFKHADTLCYQCENNQPSRKIVDPASIRSADYIAKSRLNRLREATTTSSKKKIIFGYLRHPASGLWVHPSGGLAQDGVNLVLHEGPPLRRLLLSMDAMGNICHQQSDLYVHPQNDVAQKEAALYFQNARPNSGDDKLCFEFTPEGLMRHKQSGLFVKPSGGASLDAKLRLARPGDPDVGKMEFVVDQGWTAILNDPHDDFEIY